MKELFHVELNKGKLTELRFSEPTSVINLSNNRQLKKLAACGRIYKTTSVSLEISLDPNSSYAPHDLQLTPPVDVTVLGNTYQHVDKISFVDQRMTLLNSQEDKGEQEAPQQEFPFGDWTYDPIPKQQPAVEAGSDLEKEARLQKEEALENELERHKEKCKILKAKITACRQRLDQSEEEWVKLSSELQNRYAQIAEKMETIHHDANFDLDSIGKMRENEFIQAKELDGLEIEYQGLKAKLDCLGARLRKISAKAENDGDMRSMELNQKLFAN